MKLTKSKLKQIIKEELQTLQEGFMDSPDSEEPEEEGYNVGDLVEVSISDDGYDKSIEKLAKEGEFTPTHGFYVSEKFLARIIKVSQRGEEDY
jgi:hypothetical protein